MSGVFVAGTGKYVPSQVVTNEDLSKIVETSDEWITERTGIKQRRFSQGEPAWYMGKLAALDALNDAGVAPSDIDMIIGCSVTADYFFPSLSCIIQSEIGAENAFCFDLNAACSGFIYALDTARRYLVTGGAKTVLIVCSEVLTKITDFTDRSTCVLFGDGAGAAVVKGDPGKMFGSFLRADGFSGGALLSAAVENNSPYATDKENDAYAKFIKTKGAYLTMAGKDVYRFATRVLPESIEKACQAVGIGVDDLDLIVPHQANIRIVKTAADRLKVKMDKIYTNLDKYGNTSSASIPICLEELSRSGRLQKGMKVALSGFGAGLTYGAIVMEW